jgi:hypothetical protein
MWRTTTQIQDVLGLRVGVATVAARRHEVRSAHEREANMVHIENLGR